MDIPLILAGLVVASYLLTGLLRRYALRSGILDVPNHRSSHTVPTPRGGGLAFASLFLAGVGTLLLWLPGTRNVWIAMLGGGAVVAVVGWIDDRKGLSSMVRFAAHLAVSIWAVYWLHGLPRVSLGVAMFPIGLLGYPLAALGIAWSINLYNFMDGIDGLAGGQAVLVSAIGGSFLAVTGDRPMAAVAWCLSALVAGFLLWNRPPARIFMGDVGSGLLGFIFATFAVATENRGSLPLAIWVLLLGPFVVDATATLLRRILRGEKWHEAHRSHAFQRATQAGYSHGRVTGIILCMDLLLGILAYIGWLHPVLLVPVVVLALSVLLLIWHKFSNSPAGDHSDHPFRAEETGQ